MATLRNGRIRQSIQRQMSTRWLVILASVQLNQCCAPQNVKRRDKFEAHLSVFLQNVYPTQNVMDLMRKMHYLVHLVLIKTQPLNQLSVHNTRAIF